MKIKFTILLVLAVLFGAVANAAETNKIVVAAAVTKEATKSDTVYKTGDGKYIGVIEDIQDIDNSKQAEFESALKLPSRYGAVGIIFGTIIQISGAAPIGPFGLGTLGSSFDNTSRERNDPRFYVITFTGNELPPKFRLPRVT